VTRAARPRESMAGVVWCDAAERLRLIVDRLPMPSHVAGYLRGYADSLEVNCALGAPADTTAGDVVGSRSGQLAAYICEPPSSARADVEGQRRTIEVAARVGLFTVASWHEDAEAYSENRRSTGLQDARAAIEAGAAGGIVVADLARLGRNSLDVLDLLERSDAEGWRVVALDCRLDSATADGELVIEALRLARRLEWRKVPGAKRRDPEPGRGRGTRPGAPADVEPAVAARIAAMRMEGQSYRAIAAALSDAGVAAPGDGGWGAAAVRAVLQAGRSA